MVAAILEQMAPRRLTTIAGLVVLALYVCALVISPVLHCDDADCAVKTSTHCQACLASPSALPAAPVPVDAAEPLPLAGSVVVFVSLQLAHSVETDVAGRAPPA
jgi:hypothetical protein